MNKSRRIAIGGWLGNALSIFTRGWFGLGMAEPITGYTIVSPAATAGIEGGQEGAVRGPLAAAGITAAVATGTVQGQNRTGSL